MNKAARLGRGSSFGAAAAARSSRRNLIDSAINGGDAGPAALTDLPVTLISDNPDNPRNHLRNLDETVESVREVGIVLPIVVATVDAYLRDRPHRADDLDEGARYLVVDGHRRLEAARRVGLATIPVRVDDARVSTDESLLEAAFIANYHRDDMTDLEEAHALGQLVEHYGSQTRAARRLGVPQATISSKLSLLKLSPQLQKDLVTGARRVEHVRNLGRLSPEEQRKKADERAAVDRRRTRQERPGRPQETGPAGRDGDGDGDRVSRRDGSGGDGGGLSRRDSRGRHRGRLSRREDPGAASGEAGGRAAEDDEQSVPEPRSHDDVPAGEEQTAGWPPPSPCDSPSAIATHLARTLDEPVLFETLRLLNRLARDRNPEVFQEVLHEFADQPAGPEGSAGPGGSGGSGG